ncbi:hypothetical protein J8I26_22205 [Herbaspirillum sp. LeCh32-8]|uniref:hypothetical protein n=1 Tax=Herbaspirillum sp. LeCh32-8 TaxID=2821356 RepID=UPI001AEAE991|nr:hypothetical protein [Herbaspirillum sp. LeCh32-8]MBP0600839.1 hypothetical protein [Herbaspirillum sp. LeCh32-8]
MASVAGISTTTSVNCRKPASDLAFRQFGSAPAAEKVGAGHARRRTEEDNIASIPDFLIRATLAADSRIDPFIDQRPRAHH